MSITKRFVLSVLTASCAALARAEESAPASEPAAAPVVPPPPAAESPASPAEPAPEASKAPGSISAGGFEGGGQSLGLIDGMIRLHIEQDRMLLLNPRYSMSDDDDLTAGLRLVQRRVFPSKAFHTLYLSGEVRETPGDNTFLTFASGYEHRSANYTARVRGYVSPDEADLVETRETTTKTTRADGSTATTRDTFERYEIPLSGAEAELGLRAPFPKGAGDMRFFGGWHYSDGSKTEERDGWLTRVEWRPRKFLAVEMITYFDREFSDSETFFGARFIMPFGPGASGGDAYWFDPLPVTPSTEVFAVGKSEVRARSQQSATSTPGRRPAPEPSHTPDPVTPTTPTTPSPLVPIIDPDSPL